MAGVDDSGDNSRLLVVLWYTAPSGTVYGHFVFVLSVKAQTGTPL